MKIKDVCSRFSSGSGIAASEIKPTGQYPVFGGNGLRGFTDEYNFDGACAIIGRQGAYCGNVRYFEGKAYMTEHAVVAEPTSEHNARFLAYKLGLMDLGRYAGQSAQPGLSVGTIAKVEIEMPNLDTQNKIAKLLGAIDDKIANNNAISAELEAMAKTLYDYWFLQFEFPNEEGKPYRSSGGKMVWNEELKKEIPENWKCSFISEHIKQVKGGDWGKDKPEGNYQKEVLCIRGADFPSISGSKNIVVPTRFILKQNSNKILANGDLIVEISGGSPTQSTGRICYINTSTLERFNTEIITSNFCRAFSVNEIFEQYWLYLLWQKVYDAGILFGYEGKTTGIKNLLFDNFCSEYRIVAPNEVVLSQFHSKVSPMFEKNSKQ